MVLLSALLVVTPADPERPPTGVGAAQAEPPRILSMPSMIDREFESLLLSHPGETGASLIVDGMQAFSARTLGAARAGRSLDLQYFIWHNDLTGRMLANEVHEAANRGVRVRILLDDLNAQGLDPHLLAMDAHPNIELRLYNPTRSRGGIARLLELIRRPLRINHRMHNKAWIVDGTMAIVGGRNIGDHYFDADESTNFRDLDLLLIGGAVAQASHIFQEYWDSPAAKPIASVGKGETTTFRRLLSAVRRDAQGAPARRYLDQVDAALLGPDDPWGKGSMRWSARIDVVADPPVKWGQEDRSRWLVHRLTTMISGARDSALVISPYFIPGEDGVARLAALTERGVTVGVVTNSLAATDVPAVHSGYANYRTRLLMYGVRLHELRERALGQTSGRSLGASLHTKAFVIDGKRGFVGSFNVDPRSKNLNTEMGVVFDDPALASLLQMEYQRLSTPEFSYRVELDACGRLTWLDESIHPPRAMGPEPDARRWPRIVAQVVGWLPIEAHL